MCEGARQKRVKQTFGAQSCTYRPIATGASRGCASVAEVAARPVAMVVASKPKRPWSTPNKRVGSMVDDELDEQCRSKQCEIPGCLQCMYLKNLPRWRSASCFMFDDHNVTWLAHKKTGLGCILCHAAGFEGRVLGKFLGGPACLKVATLRRHGASEQHRRALGLLNHKASPQNVWRPPRPDEFKKVWEDVRSGKAQTVMDGEKLPNRRKRRAMEWCLAEALRKKGRDFVQHAATISLSSDARKGRLVVRFSGSRNGTMEVRQGTLGLERDYGAGNEAMTRAIEVVLERFCTEGACCPGSRCRCEAGQPPAPCEGACRPGSRYPPCCEAGQPPAARDAAEILLDPSRLQVHDSGETEDHKSRGTPKKTKQKRNKKQKETKQKRPKAAQDNSTLSCSQSCGKPFRWSLRTAPGMATSRMKTSSPRPSFPTCWCGTMTKRMVRED